MSIKYKLREWLTVQEAAKHLSISFGEDITEADILRLAIEGALSLSIHLLEPVKAQRGGVVRYTEAEIDAAIQSGTLPPHLEWLSVSAEVVSSTEGLYTYAAGDDMMTNILPNSPKPITILISPRIGDDQYLSFDNPLEALCGVWDLPMLGNERLIVQNKYQLLTGVQPIYAIDPKGTFLKRLNGDIYRLMLTSSEVEFLEGPNDYLQEMRDSSISENPELAKSMSDYNPAFFLPDSSQIVVRTESLREFENLHSATSASVEKPLNTNERNTLLVIITALCKRLAIDPTERGAAARIAKLTEENGTPVSDDTVRRILKNIQNALETRMK